MMKGISLNSRKTVKKPSLHMKGSERDSKIEKYFGFSKMDKKNVQNWKAKKVLTDENSCLRC